MARSLGPLGVKVQKAMTEHLTTLLHEMGKQMHYRSAQLAPYLSGKLRRSGKLTLLPNGFLLVYEVPYARRREYGMRAHVEHVRYHRVKGHLRKVAHRRKAWQRNWTKGHFRNRVLRRGYFRISKNPLDIGDQKTFVKPHARHAHERHCKREKAQPYVRPARREVIKSLQRGLKQRLGSQIRIQ